LIKFWPKQRLSINLIEIQVIHSSSFKKKSWMNKWILFKKHTHTHFVKYFRVSRVIIIPFRKIGKIQDLIAYVWEEFKATLNIKIMFSPWGQTNYLILDSKNISEVISMFSVFLLTSYLYSEISEQNFFFLKTSWEKNSEKKFFWPREEKINKAFLAEVIFQYEKEISYDWVKTPLDRNNYAFPESGYCFSLLQSRNYFFSIFLFEFMKTVVVEK